MTPFRFLFFVLPAMLLLAVVAIVREVIRGERAE